MGAETFKETFKRDENGWSHGRRAHTALVQTMFEKAEHSFSIAQKSIHVSTHERKRGKTGVHKRVIYINKDKQTWRPLIAAIRVYFIVCVP